MASSLDSPTDNIFHSNTLIAALNPSVDTSEAINQSFENASDNCVTTNVSERHDSNWTGPCPIVEHTLTERTEPNLDVANLQASVGDIEQAMPTFNSGSRSQTRTTANEPDILENVAPQIILAFFTQRAPYLTLGSIYKFVRKWARTDSLKGDIDRLLHSYDFSTQPFQLPNGETAFELPLGIDTPIEAPYFPDKPFRLMDLPLRIRLKCYNYVLSMPTAHGWIIDQYYTEYPPRFYNDSLQNPGFPPLRLRTLATPRWSLFSRPLQEVLSLISASKDIYNEAMPVFYGTNTFRFESCDTLYGFLSGIPTRRPFIKNVILTYDPSLYNSSCDKAFQLLAQTNIKRLYLTLNETHVLNLGNGCGNVARMPGFYTLERIRGLNELSFSGDFQRSMKFLRKMLEPRAGAEPDLEEVLEEEYGVLLARRTLDLKEEVKRLRKAVKRATLEQKKMVQRAEKEEELERRKAERAVKKVLRDEFLEAERSRHKAEVLQKRIDKERERKREREAKEEIRVNKQWAQVEKARLTAKAKDLMKQQQEEGEDEDEARVGPPMKRRKVNTNVSHESSTPRRGRGGRGGSCHINNKSIIQVVVRGRGGGRGAATRIPAQKPIKTVSGSSREVTKVPFLEQSSSDDESIDGLQAVDKVDDMNIDPQLLEIDRLNALRQAREMSTESEAD